ncbi:hypothetical protein HYU12_02230 [Candidatus Woesearchaeota archaeon]|nr:hypothetical protein [Candidatus Woesearchaeota archaeon]
MLQKDVERKPLILPLKHKGENLEQITERTPHVKETPKENHPISRRAMTAQKPHEQEYQHSNKTPNTKYQITPTANEAHTQRTKQNWAYGIESVVEKGLHAINSFTHPLSPTERIEGIAKKVKQLYHKTTEYAKSFFQPPQDKTYKYQ